MRFLSVEWALGWGRPWAGCFPAPSVCWTEGHEGSPVTMACTVCVREQPSVGVLMEHPEAVRQGAPCPWVLSSPVYVGGVMEPHIRVMSSPAYAGAVMECPKSVQQGVPWPWDVSPPVWNVVCEVPTGLTVVLWSQKCTGEAEGNQG